MNDISVCNLKKNVSVTFGTKSCFSTNAIKEYLSYWCCLGDSNRSNLIVERLDIE